MSVPPDEHPAFDLHVTDSVPSAVAVHQVRLALVEWGLTRLVEAVCLVVTELLDNAVKHAGGPTSVCVELPGSLFVEVYDSSPKVPRLVRDDPTRRGLLVVEQLANDWGTIPNGDGKCVFAEFWDEP